VHENRETSTAPAAAGRSEKANNQNADTYAGEESDRAIVPMKLPNKEAKASAEAAEGRARTKESGAELNTRPTQSGERVLCLAKMQNASLLAFGEPVPFSSGGRS